MNFIFSEMVYEYSKKYLLYAIVLSFAILVDLPFHVQVANKIYSRVEDTHKQTLVLYE